MVTFEPVFDIKLVKPREGKRNIFGPDFPNLVYRRPKSGRFALDTRHEFSPPPFHARQLHRKDEGGIAVPKTGLSSVALE